jgi:hypothetical protein
MLFFKHHFFDSMLVLSTENDCFLIELLKL